MKVLGCGGRDYGNWRHVFYVLDLYRELAPAIEIIHGGAKGADERVALWAKLGNVPVKVFPAHWDRYGRSAGFVRNKQMLAEGKPDLVVAFPGGRGTQMMVDIAAEVGVSIVSCRKWWY